MSSMKKVLRVAGIGLGALVLAAGIGFAVASVKANGRLSQHFESHRINLAVPNPLTKTELEDLRAERAKANGTPTEPGADVLAGVNLAKLAEERAIARG